MTRRAAADLVPREVVEELKAAYRRGNLEALLMQRHGLEAVRLKSEEKRIEREILTNVMKARNGRHPPKLKPGNLKNAMPEKRPTEYMGLFEDDGLAGEFDRLFPWPRDDDGA